MTDTQQPPQKKVEESEGPGIWAYHPDDLPDHLRDVHHTLYEGDHYHVAKGGAK